MALPNIEAMPLPFCLDLSFVGFALGMSAKKKAPDEKWKGGSLSLFFFFFFFLV
jgi:hypothetical protein